MCALIQRKGARIARCEALRWSRRARASAPRPLDKGALLDHLSAPLGAHLPKRGKQLDPNETLDRIRDILYGATDDYPHELADLIEALDHWIMAGGFLPAQWSTAQMRGPA